MDVYSTVALANAVADAQFDKLRLEELSDERRARVDREESEEEESLPAEACFPRTTPDGMVCRSWEFTWEEGGIVRPRHVVKHKGNVRVVAVRVMAAPPPLHQPLPPAPQPQPQQAQQQVLPAPPAPPLHQPLPQAPQPQQAQPQPQPPRDYRKRSAALAYSRELTEAFNEDRLPLDLYQRQNAQAIADLDIL
jgi:hypothetical protein